MKVQLSTKDLILLSSLLDDELNPREKARVETRLQADPKLREALASLRTTKEVLRRAPARRVPHNFTLPASMARSKPARSYRVVPGLLWSAAVTAVVSILFVAATLVGLQFYGGQLASAPRDMTTEQSQLTAPVEAPAAAPSQQPPMVYWNGLPTPQAVGGGGPEVATGLGGGGGSGGDGNISPPIVYPTEPPTITKLGPEETPLAETGVFAGTSTASPEPTLPAQAEQPITGTGPILGIAPTAQQGEILPETNQQYLPAVSAERAGTSAAQFSLPLLVWIGIGLFVIAGGLFVAAVILRRKAPR